MLAWGGECTRHHVYLSLLQLWLQGKADTRWLALCGRPRAGDISHVVFSAWPQRAFGHACGCDVSLAVEEIGVVFVAPL